MKHLILIGALILTFQLLAMGDTLVLNSGVEVTGTVVHTNGNGDLLILADYGTFCFARSSLKEIKFDQVEKTDYASTNRLPAFKQTVNLLAEQPWASDIRQIPATVIDQGTLKNVPYVSFRCSDDYEVNVYGDLSHPAGIEAGIYRGLLTNSAAKNNCLRFIGKLLGQADDKRVIYGLKPESDLQKNTGFTFEITPPSAQDAYGGWWISVYSETELNHARASDADVKQISVAKADVAKQSMAKNQDPSAWSSDDLKFSRDDPDTVSFVTKSGLVVTNAHIKVYREGVSVIWRTKEGYVGISRLADLSQELQSRFNYDSTKSAIADAEEQKRRTQNLQSLSSYSDTATSYSSASAGSDTSTASSYSATGGRIYVSGYYRGNGTYVHSYTRSR